MKTYLMFIIFLGGFTLIIPLWVFVSGVDILNPNADNLEPHNNNPKIRPVLSSNGKEETMLVAFLDGTINLVDINSMKILWSFLSGPPVYSSYQAPLDDHIMDNENIYDFSEGTKSHLHRNFHIDIGPDWNLYMHDFNFGRMKLDTTISEYVNGSPYILEDGRVIVGSEKVKTFEVDGNNGNVGFSVSNSGVDFHEENSTISKQNKRIYITRTDYLVNTFGPHSDKVVWNLTVAEIEASLVCDGLGDNNTPPHEPCSEYDQSDKILPLQCSRKATRLVALLDGTINLVDSNSQKVLWSFSTGPPIYSSYQVLHDDDTLDRETKAPPHVDTLDGRARPFFSNKYFIDMGVDWKLYMHGNIFGKVKLEMTISEYLNSLRHISEDGRVTTGSKKTTLFKVDGNSGKINVSYGIGDPNGTPSIVPKEDVEKIKKSRTLYITMTDNSIVGFASSGEVLWNLTAAEIGDALLCEDDKFPQKYVSDKVY